MLPVFPKILSAEEVYGHEGQALRQDPREDFPLWVRVVFPQASGPEPADVQLRREVVEVG